MWRDILLLNLAAIGSFLLRQNYGDFVVKQAPSLFWGKYLSILLLLNLVFPFIFWMLGLYDKRQKRALLEEYMLIFGVLSTGVAVMIVFFFLGRLWWMSRIVLFAFWGLAVVLLSLSRLIWRDVKNSGRILRYDPVILQSAMAQKKRQLESGLKVGLSVIIVTYNSKGKIESCLRSLKNADLKMPYEVIVVDNKSNDGSLGSLSGQLPNFKVIVNKVNLGYSKAINIGIKAAVYEQVLVLNPDIIVMPGVIEIMLDYLARNNGVGLLGCKLLNEDGTLQYSVRRFLDLRTYLYRFTPLRGLMAGSAIERYYLMQEWNHNNNRLVDWVLGGCMLARKQALADVGLMDEHFFIYFEDVDLCYQLWVKGWQVAYVAEAAMFHKHMRTSANKLFNRATYEHFKSLLYFLWKHGLKLPANSPSVGE